MSTTKQCSAPGCCQSDPEQFSPSKTTKDRLRYNCKACAAADAKKWRADNKGRVRSNNRAYWARNKKSW